MEDLNKISSTRVGDNIHFYVNGAEDKGVVVKMDTGYVTVLKDDGNFQDIHINDTFFIKDILVNKTWNDMTMEERSVKLVEIKAYSPRFVGKSWQELPRELKEVLEKSNVEESKLGTAAGSPQSGVNTNQKDDATDDYEGQTEDEKKEQFKHEDKKPVTKSMQEQLWEDWLNKETMSGGDSSPAQTAITTGTTGMYNAVYGKDGRIKGQEKDKDEEDTEKDKEEKEKERKG
jgi:ribosomal protein L12E/L44/L45/RPP1/RPP2